MDRLPSERLSLHNKHVSSISYCADGIETESYNALGMKMYNTLTFFILIIRYPFP